MRRALGIDKILGLALVAWVGVAGCNLVGERVTGLSFQAGPNECIKDCVDVQTASVQAEATRHQAEVEACEALPEAEQEGCLAAEAARHQAVMAQIGDDRNQCMNGCHQQGAGNAG